MACEQQREKSEAERLVDEETEKYVKAFGISKVTRDECGETLVARMVDRHDGGFQLMWFLRRELVDHAERVLANEKEKFRRDIILVPKSMPDALRNAFPFTIDIPLDSIG